jgi:hypothetical protein|tara:strand:- start:5992 stop:6780 length:789 start_codon:yes stop_codon:yes gene_type:complete
MASFTGVGDNVELAVPNRGEEISIDISGTYDMTIELQREQGSPSSGSWRSIKSWNTANATVAETYTTTHFNQKIRLIVLIDNSGTATATLTDNDDRTLHVLKDDVGNTLQTWRQSGTEFAGGVRLGDPVAITASDTLTAAEHAGRVVKADAAAGLTVTMPAATGTGDVYTIFFGTTVSSNDYIVQAASSSDVFNGGVSISTNIAGVTMLAAATTDTITMNGSTTGGLVGSWVQLTDVASGVFMLDGFLCSTGTEATPFSAAV